MYIFNTYSAASGSLNASHKCEIAQQQRDGEIQVNKHVNSMEELLSVKSRVQIRAFTIMKFASDMYSKHQGSYSMTQGSCLLHILFPWFVNTLCLLVACLHGITLSVQQTMLPPPPTPRHTDIQIEQCHCYSFCISGGSCIVHAHKYSWWFWSGNLLITQKLNSIWPFLSYLLFTYIASLYVLLSYHIIAITHDILWKNCQSAVFCHNCWSISCWWIHINDTFHNQLHFFC